MRSSLIACGRGGAGAGVAVAAMAHRAADAHGSSRWSCTVYSEQPANHSFDDRNYFLKANSQMPSRAACIVSNDAKKMHAAGAY